MQESIASSVVDPLEPSVGALLGDDHVAHYRLDALADPFVASAVVVPCWLLAGALADAYAPGASLRTAEDALRSVLLSYAIYLPCVATALFLLGQLRGAAVAAPDVTFCAGALSVVGSWRFTLANTIGR